MFLFVLQVLSSWFMFRWFNDSEISRDHIYNYKEKNIVKGCFCRINYKMLILVSISRKNNKNKQIRKEENCKIISKKTVS